jgi:hypothetical protein
MAVNVWNNLPRDSTVVKKHIERFSSRRLDERATERGHYGKKLSTVIRSHVHDVGVMLARNDQKVTVSQRAYVEKSDDGFILEHDGGRDFRCDDLAEDAIGIAWHSTPP